jgi:hypothetical protein
MGRQYTALKEKDVLFINKAKLFFIASCSSHEVNLSPRGYDSIRIRDNQTLIFLDYPGSGNRTARDIREGGRVTLMWCAFEGPANIMRCFCSGELIEPGDMEFDACLSHFSDVDVKAIRRFIRFHIEAVETSCGEGVPFMSYEGERDSLKSWASGLAEDGRLSEYMADHDEPPVL